MPVQSGAGGTEAGGFDPSKAAKPGGLRGIFQQAGDMYSKATANLRGIPVEPLAPASIKPVADEETFNPFSGDPNASPRPATWSGLMDALPGITSSSQQPAETGIPDDKLPDWLQNTGQGESSANPVQPASPAAPTDAEEWPAWMPVANPATSAGAPAAPAVSDAESMINRHRGRLASESARAGAPAAPAPAPQPPDLAAAEDAGVGEDEGYQPRVYNTDNLDIPAFLRGRAEAPGHAGNASFFPQTRRADDIAEHATKGGSAALEQGQRARPDWLSAVTPEPIASQPAAPAAPVEIDDFLGRLAAEPQPVAPPAPLEAAPFPTAPAAHGENIDDFLGRLAAEQQPAAPPPAPEAAPLPTAPAAPGENIDDFLGRLAAEQQPAAPPPAPVELGAKLAFNTIALLAASDLQKQSSGSDAAPPADAGQQAAKLVADALTAMTTKKPEAPSSVAPPASDANTPPASGSPEAQAAARKDYENVIAAAIGAKPASVVEFPVPAPAPEAAPRATYESLVTQYGLPKRSAETVRKIIENSDLTDRNGVEKTVSAIVDAVGVLPQGKTLAMAAQELYDSISTQPQNAEPEKPQAQKEKKPKKYKKGELPFSDQLADLSFTTDELADIRAQLKFASGATLRPEGDKGALKSEEDVRGLQFQFIQARLATKFHVDLSGNQKGASVKGFDLKEVAQAAYDAFKREETQYLQENPQVAWLYGKIKDLKAANEANPRLEVSLVAAQRAQAYSDAEQFKEARAVLQKMEDSGALKGGTVKEVERADLDFRGISATYHDIEVRDAGVKYLEYVAQIMAGSSGDNIVPPQIVDSIHAHQRSEAFRRFREIATHPKKGSMITLSADNRYYIFAKDGRPVTLDTINAVIGMNEKGLVDNPKALVNGAAEVILGEVAKVTMLNDSIRNGEEAVGRVQADHNKRIDAIRTSKIEGVHEVCESALSEAGSQASLLQREIDAKQKEIDAIKESPEASDQVTEPVRKARLAQMSLLSAQLATLNVSLKREQAGHEALLAEKNTIIQGTVEGVVNPAMDAMRASADEDVYVLKAQLLRQGPERIQLYHDQVLATALREGTTAMGELSKWQSLLTRQGREEVVDKVAQTLLQNQSQLDSFQARRSFLQGLTGKKKGDLPSELASLKPAERTKKISEEIQLLTAEIDRLDGERRDNYTRSYNALIPLETVFNTRQQSKVGEIYQFAVLGGEAMVPTGDGTTRERVVKPGLKQLARYDELQGEIDARVKELREEAGMQPAAETPAQAPLSPDQLPKISAPIDNAKLTQPVPPQSITAVPGLKNASGV